MKKYIFTLKDDQLNSALVRTRGGRTKVLNSAQIVDSDISKLFENYSLTEVERLREPIQAFIESHKKRANTGDFILGLDSIISRSIEVPYLNKKELRTYLNHNVSDLFTVDMDEYFFDYKILQVLKKTSSTPKMLQLKLVVVPRAIIIGITKVAEAFGFKLGKINIYPDIMQRLVNKDEGMGFLDIGPHRSILNIYDEGATFIYTSIDNQNDNLEDFTDEVEYFTDFYASRHQGQPLKYLYMIGGEKDYTSMIDYMDVRLASIVEPIDPSVFKKKASEKDAKDYPVVVLNEFKVKEIRGETINFSDEPQLKEKKVRTFQPIHLSLIFLMITLAWVTLYNNYLNDQVRLYSGDRPDSTLYLELQTELDDLTLERDRLLALKVAVQDMKSQNIDYEKAVKDLFELIPNDVNVAYLNIKASSTLVRLSNVTSTTDLIEVLIAFNTSGIYEEIQLKDVILNDAIGEYEVELTKAN